MKIGRLAATVLVSSLLVTPPRAVAQGRPARADSLRAAAARLERGTPVRVELRGGDVVTGRIAAAGDDGLRLEGRKEPLSLSEVDGLRARGRSTGTGFRAGGIVGASAGAVGGALVGWVAGALCETSNCAGVGTHVLAGAGLGLLAGAVAGGALGAIVGATVPRWVEPGRAGPAGIGGVSATGAWSRFGSGGEGSGLGGDVSFLAAFGPLEVGPEVAYNGLGTGTLVTHVPCSGSTGADVPDSTGLCEARIPVARHAWHAGGVVRVNPLRGRVRPYVVAGVGYYSWSGLDLAGYSAGAGIQWAPGRVGPGLHLEARWHSNLSRAGPSASLGYFTLGAGGDLGW